MPELVLLLSIFVLTFSYINDLQPRMHHSVSSYMQYIQVNGSQCLAHKHLATHNTHIADRKNTVVIKLKFTFCCHATIVLRCDCASLRNVFTPLCNRFASIGKTLLYGYRAFLKSFAARQSRSQPRMQPRR